MGICVDMTVHHVGQTVDKIHMKAWKLISFGIALYLTSFLHRSLESRVLSIQLNQRRTACLLVLLPFYPPTHLPAYIITCITKAVTLGTAAVVKITMAAIDADVKTYD